MCSTGIQPRGSKPKKSPENQMKQKIFLSGDDCQFILNISLLFLSQFFSQYMDIGRSNYI